MGSVLNSVRAGQGARKRPPHREYNKSAAISTGGPKMPRFRSNPDRRTKKARAAQPMMLDKMLDGVWGWLGGTGSIPDSMPRRSGGYVVELLVIVLLVGGVSLWISTIYTWARTGFWIGPSAGVIAYLLWRAFRS